ncbi:hypothetical protein E2C01_094113 [Portunus trituberculatus]|uniref:Uncharacterized protein n=1 Tax=Portunus trituberculatus TaxID=210409 RepID=A0A5B7JRM4_PORTR|nr:hypothetical protein [Portunus trituberculatus]
MTSLLTYGGWDSDQGDTPRGGDRRAPPRVLCSLPTPLSRWSGALTHLDSPSTFTQPRDSWTSFIFI